MAKAESNTTRTIALGADHAGYELKEALKPYLEQHGYTVEDCGTFDAAPADYPKIAYEVARRVSDGTCARGVIIDGAGIGSISTGQADFVMDWITNLPEWWLADPPIEPDTFWVGRSVDIYGNGLITRPELLAADRDLVERFVAGAIEGYEYVIENGEAGHQEAIDALFKFNPELKEQPNAEEFHLGNLKLFLTLMLTEDVRDDGLGYFDPDKKQRSLDFINDFLLDAPLTLDQAFISDLIIEKGDVKVDDFDGALASLNTVLGRANPLAPFLD